MSRDASQFRIKSFEYSSAAAEADDAFSKPVVRQRFQRTQASSASDIATDDSLLPSVTVPDESSLAQVFSPQVSIPESCSTDGNADNNLSSSGSDNEDEAAVINSSQSSTTSINRKLQSSSLASTVNPAPLPEKKIRLYDFDDDEDSMPTQKKPKTEASSEKFIPRKEKKTIYNHKWNPEDIDDFNSAEEEKKTGQFSESAMKSTAVQPARLMRKPIYARPPKSQATGRVRNVKEAHEILESGEHDDFKHELEYILSSLNTESIKLKCLSTVSLAKKCVSSEFRHFIRSEGMMNNIFRALYDAPENGIFSLCAATVIYLLSRDFNSMKIDVSALRLFSQLIRVESYNSPDKEEFINKVWEVFGSYLEKMESGGKKIVFELKKSDITPSSLTLESLVFIVTRNGHDEGLKTELLSLGVLQWVVAKAEKLVEFLSSTEETPESKEAISNSIILLDRCFRVLEMSSMLHRKNQAFLISHRGSVLINTCAKFLDSVHNKLSVQADRNDASMSYMACLALMARVLINMSHENELCCSKLGQIPGFLLSCVSAFTFLAPKFASEEKTFDIYVMMCSLLVNLIERCNANRKKILDVRIKIANEGVVDEMDSVEALAKLFTDHEAKAKTIDEDLDKELAFEELGENEGDESGSGEDDEDDDAEDGTRRDGRLDRAKLESMGQEDMVNAVQQVMNKASAHMEDSVVASYLALLLGCLLQQNEEKVEQVKKFMPDGTLLPMIGQLQRFLEFMKIALTSKKSEHNSWRSIERILDLLERLN